MWPSKPMDEIDFAFRDLGVSILKLCLIPEHFTRSPGSNDACPFWIDGHNPFGYLGFDNLNSQLYFILPLLFLRANNPLMHFLFNPMAILHSGTSVFDNLKDLSFMFSWSSFTWSSRSVDTYPPKVPNQLETCHCLIAPHVLADVVLLTWIFIHFRTFGLQDFEYFEFSNCQLFQSENPQKITSLQLLDPK
jgi:hypothetical protein